MWLERRNRRLLRCTACGFAWVPDGVLQTARALSIYEDQEFDLYSRETDYYRDEGAEDAARAKVEWVGRFVRAGGRLLDVGANVGTFVRHAAERFDAVGIDPNPGAVAWGREHIGGHVEVGSIQQEVAGFVGRFDVLTMFDVIEHLDDPAAALQQCRRYLRSGGMLFITTPDIGSVSARLLGRAWYYVDLEQHVSMFSGATLSALLRSHDFDIINRRTFGRRYRFSYIERRLKDLSHQSGLLRVLHALAVPLRLSPGRHIHINVGDVIGIAAVRR